MRERCAQQQGWLALRALSHPILSGEEGCYHEAMCTSTSSFTIVPGPPSTESIECTYHSPITDAACAVTHQSQHTRSTSCQRTCATPAALGSRGTASLVADVTNDIPASHISADRSSRGSQIWNALPPSGQLSAQIRPWCNATRC